MIHKVFTLKKHPSEYLKKDQMKEMQYKKDIESIQNAQFFNFFICSMIAHNCAEGFKNDLAQENKMYVGRFISSSKPLMDRMKNIISDKELYETMIDYASKYGEIATRYAMLDVDKRNMFVDMALTCLNEIENIKEN